MQKPILPIQISSASPAPTRAKNSAPDGGVQFNATLNREIAQRKAPPAPTPAPAKQNGPVKQQQAQQTDKAGVPKKTGNEPAARVAKEKPDAKAGVVEDTATQAAVQNPVVDMLALVASFNQPAAATVPAEVEGDALPGRTASVQFMDGKFAAAVATAGMDKLAAAGTALLEEGAAPEAMPAQFSDVMTQLDGNVRDRAKPVGVDNAGQVGQDKAVQGKDLAAAARTGDAGKAAPEPAQFSMRGIDTRQQESVPKDLPVSAPVSAPVQQASLALNNAANGVGAGDKIPARVGTPGWDNQVGQKIVWMVAGKEQSATLTLNPPDMGPMQVVLNVTNDHATVTFSSATPEVRQALEDAMPKLREMMSESGIALGNASVNDGAAQQQQAREDNGGRTARGGGTGAPENTASGSAAEAEAKAAARPARAGELPGLVDTFA